MAELPAVKNAQNIKNILSIKITKNKIFQVV